MSQVSSVFIITSCVNAENLASLNAWLEREDVLGIFPLQKVSGETSAGNKYPQRTLYWGGFNFLREDAFVDFFKTLKWEGTLLILGSENIDTGHRIVVGGSEECESRIRLEVPSIDTEYFPLVEIHEYRKKEDLMEDSNDLFQDLEI